MKTDIHPDYQAVVFRDLGSGETFLTRSTVTSDKTIELDGVEYPVIDVEISSASHPFYTGKQRIMDSAGRATDSQPSRNAPLRRGLSHSSVAVRALVVSGPASRRRGAPPDRGVRS